MAVLEVTPIDPTAKHSFKEQVKIFDLIEAIAEATKAGDGAGIARAYRSAVKLILPRLRMEDGSDPTAAIDEMSIEEFSGLLGQIGRTATKASDDAVPTTPVAA